MKKILIGVFAVSLSVGIAAAQDKSATTAQTTATADPVVIKFGTTEVHKAEFEAAVKSLPPEYQSIAAGPGKKMFAEEYVRLKMLAAEGEKNGVLKDPSVQAQLALVRDNTIANAEVERINREMKLPDADLKKAYDEQKASFEKLKSRHILIAFKGSPAAVAGKKELTEEEAKAKAEDLRKKLIAGADFATMAKAESDDTGSGAQGGDLPPFGHGEMVPEFEKAAFDAKVGEITPVVRTQYGYHIIQVRERTTATMDEARPQLEGKVRQELLKKHLEEMKASQPVTYDTTYFGSPEPTPAPQAAPAEAPKSEQPKKPAAKPAPKH